MQTAVEWLINEVRNSIQGMSVTVKEDIFKQANKMFDQQMIDAVNIDKRQYDDAQQYYNHTFKK